jgi:cyclopropane fatty-acyl-phospholipid synthase-like methyltransferase
MSCCSGACGEFFTERVARRDARRYRRKGLDANARRVVDLVCERGLHGRTILEVGGGVGGIQLELLKAGAERVVNVEASPAYEEYARALADEAGLADRIERRVLDFARAPEGIPRADFVVMHKVVCCYPDYQGLVDPAAARAGETLLLTFPREAWWTRFGISLANAVERLRRHSFRAFVHPPDRIVAVAEARGLHRAHEHRGAIWKIVALDRA